MTEPIIAYRSWAISASKRQIKSTGQGTKAWARLSAPAAQCVHSDMMSNYYYSIAQWMSDLYGIVGDDKPRPDEAEHHEAPAFKCKCGYYAMKRVQDIPTGGNVYGRVALWGHVIEHDHGYRAQYAYPQVFFAPPNATEKFLETLKGLAQQYGCEIAPMPQELIDELSKREKDAADARKRQSLWIMDDPVKSGGAWTYTVSYGTGTNAPTEPQDKREKGFSAKTMSHPFRAFLGIDPADRRRKK